MSVIKGLDKLLSKMNKAPKIVHDEVVKEVRRKTLAIQKDAKRNAPTGITGDLRRSIKAEVESDGKGVVGRVHTNQEAAMYVEFGTGPVGKGTADIVPKGVILQYRDTPWFVNAKDFPDYDRYRFITISAGEETFILVRGQKAQQFMNPAAQKYKETVSDDMSSSIRKRMIKELKK
ncbi:HK97 gp10 family phage protein [Erysipelothrix sp. HDW6A]|uniref:HK97-gp10 family putative phage morphogenesis protein n=1 Tax=Erysipelothrix sp. HDW6A TaxID=2714928 RepID=UPI00140D35BF|nr:HK97-gp10 family putative phage morphogenesis protein [Erysipelothrix sp. HDW6A]QIK57770.1 HK97 gp10 family phage protein [Erysipelothrix sp. HDW6A]